jgi:hypothetical protein
MNPSARRRRRGPPAINHAHEPRIPESLDRTEQNPITPRGTYQREGECRRRREDAGARGGGVGVLRGRLLVVEDTAEAHALRRLLLHLLARATLPVPPSASGRRSKRGEPGRRAGSR